MMNESFVVFQASSVFLETQKLTMRVEAKVLDIVKQKMSYEKD